MTLEDQIIAIELPYSRGEFMNESEYLRYKEGFEDAKRLTVEFWSCASKDIKVWSEEDTKNLDNTLDLIFNEGK